MSIGVPTLTLTETVLRLCLAMMLGGLVGLERERLERAAGIRTHAIVALAAALIMIVSAYGFSDVLGPGQYVSLDVSRIAAQVVSGIGFLGAGVIIFRRNVVRGLTTAASVWAVAGLGLACGGGLFAAAGITTVLILLLQTVLRPIEQRLFSYPREHRLELRVRREAGSLAAVESAIRQAGGSIASVRVTPEAGDQEDRVDVTLDPTPDALAVKLLDRLRAVEGTQLVSYVAGTPPAASGDADDSGADRDD